MWWTHDLTDHKERTINVVDTTPTSGDIECTGELDVGRYENIIVSSGECQIYPTTEIRGSIQQKGGSLLVDSVQIVGNLQVEAGIDISLSSNTIGGNVQIEKTVGTTNMINNEVIWNVQINQKTSGNIYVENSIIVGSLQAQQNVVDDMAVMSNDIDGDMLEQQNTSNHNIIADNTIDGNLQCQENVVAPENNGLPNSVGGNSEGQCVGL